MTKDELKILLPLLEARIPFDESIWEEEDTWEEMLTNLLNDSKNILLSKLYPFEDFSSYLIPKSRYNWVLRCSLEIYNLNDKWGVTNYAENGLSWAKYTDGLSKSLITELVSHAYVPKKNVIVDDTQTNGEETND